MTPGALSLAGVELSSASVLALLTKEPNQVKLSTLIALCTTLDCTPNDLFDVDTTPLEQPTGPAQAHLEGTQAAGRGRSLPPMTALM